MKNEEDPDLKFRSCFYREKTDQTVGDSPAKPDFIHNMDMDSWQESTREFFSSPCLLSEFEEDEETH